MRSAVESRLSGPLSLLAMLLGAVTTNCDDCGDVDTTGAPQFVDPGPGDTESVPGCVGKIEPANLQAPEQCLGMSSGGEEIKPFHRSISRCPDGGSYAANQRFQVYWTLCNTSASTPAAALPYGLSVHSAQGGVESPTPTLTVDLVQPTLTPCDCSTQIVVFNAPGEPGSQSLAPGAYRFRLTGIYGAGQINYVSPEQILIDAP